MGSTGTVHFRTDEGMDDLPISALLTYLNAAIPQDKYEDLDTHKVAEGLVALDQGG